MYGENIQDLKRKRESTPGKNSLSSNPLIKRAKKPIYNLKKEASAFRTISIKDLKKKIARLKQKAYECLTISYKAGATNYLKLLQMGTITEIDQDIPKLDALIANLILQHEIPEALEALFKSVRPENRLVLIFDKDDHHPALTQFIQRSLSMSHDQYQASSENKRKLLKLLTEIDPIMIKIIRIIIIRSISSDLQHKLDPLTIAALQNDF